MIRKALILTFVGFALALAAPSSKVEEGLARTLKSEGSANCFVTFNGGNKAALRRVEILKFSNRADKVTHLVKNLKSLVESSQQNALDLLKARTVSFRQFWASNELYVKGASVEVINSLAALPEVGEIREERIVTLEPMSPDEGEVRPLAEWNIEKIEVPGAWALPGGNNGVGVVVANIDTGVRHTHEALRTNFRERYGWFDPYDGTSLPSDGNGHGTHTMGILVGAGGIGVAPGAQWIACRGCSSSSCSESELKQCGQWVLCPTLPDGESEDCSRAPKVVSNSWGGGQGNAWYNEIIDAWKAADIVPVFAIGGSSSCGTANSPGDQDVIGVGATTSDDALSSSSSAGPSVEGRLKPDITAPGSLIRSAWSTSDSAYQQLSGTSMAAPHIAGAATLLLSRNPNLTYAQVKELLENNADTDLQDTGATCGGIPSTVFPNNQYGYGRVNTRRALEAAINNG
ncbi:unnamed protein product [Orchesella dallaii]|uniref:Peptidase S8/S53 domain-containing protein n=1 Tax=Orchesella dallaii TaxID=48710 RepID=A0ABP1Q0G0_9HEXA